MSYWSDQKYGTGVKGLWAWGLSRLRAAAMPCSAALVRCSIRIDASNRGLCQRATSPAAYTFGAARQYASHTTPSRSVSPLPASHSVLGREPMATRILSPATISPAVSRTPCSVTSVTVTPVRSRTPRSR